jgi:hypothetical protein
MGTNEPYEGHLSAKIEGDDQTIVSSGDFESDALTVKDLGFWGGSLDLLNQRSSETFASGCLLQKSTSEFRAMTLMAHL